MRFKVSRSGVSRTARRSVIWMRRWARTSKPTEWVASFTGLLTVCSAITAGLFLIFNGFFDQKKSEYEMKKSELAIQITKAEMEQERLATAKGYLETRVSDATIALRLKEDELERTKGTLEKANAELTLLKTNIHDQEKWNRLRNTLVKYNSDKHTVRVAVFRRNDEDEHPRSIFGINISNQSYRSQLDKYEMEAQARELSDILSAIEELPGLTLLSIDGIDVNGHLAAISFSFNRLNALYLTKCKLGDTNISDLVIKEGVTTLSLADNDIRNLPTIQPNTHLKGLNLNGTKVTDSVIEHTLSNSTGLQILHLAGTDVSDKTLLVIGDKCKSLRELNILSTSITPLGLAQYYSSNDCNIIAGANSIEMNTLVSDSERFTPYRTISIVKGKYEKSTSTYNGAEVIKKGEKTSSFVNWNRWMKIEWTWEFNNDSPPPLVK